MLLQLDRIFSNPGHSIFDHTQIKAARTPLIIGDSASSPAIAIRNANPTPGIHDAPAKRATNPNAQTVQSLYRCCNHWDN
jgi:hypothetical protein